MPATPTGYYDFSPARLKVSCLPRLSAMKATTRGIHADPLLFSSGYQTGVQAHEQAPHELAALAFAGRQQRTAVFPVHCQNAGQCQFPVSDSICDGFTVLHAARKIGKSYEPDATQIPGIATSVKKE
jgi:hypothetical protein